MTNKGLKPSTGTLSHTGITSAAQHDKTVSQAKTSGQLAVINHGQCSAGLECHFHRNMVQKRGWWAGMLTQNCALCTTVVTCTHNSLSLSTVGLDVCGCEELQILDSSAVAAKRFMSENVRTIGSHDMKETKFSRCPSRAMLFCCCWAGGMPPPQKHGFKKRFVTCISCRMRLMVGRLECWHRNNLCTQRL